MATYGWRVLNSTGIPLQITADGLPDWKAIGATIDWSTVIAAVSDTTYASGTVLKAGQQGLPAGTVLCRITASGKYGPAATAAGGATAATDGRQLPAFGACGILNEDLLLNGPTGLGYGSGPSGHTALVEGGLVWVDRMQVGGPGQPTLAQLEAALPRLRFAQN